MVELDARSSVAIASVCELGNWKLYSLGRTSTTVQAAVEMICKADSLIELIADFPERFVCDIYG
jgi:hypothetical protein